MFNNKNLNKFWKAQLFKLNFGRQELNAVRDVLKSGWITMGPKTTEFETKFSEFHEVDVKSLAVANGTAALHLALLSLGVSIGDEVTVPALTFVADINVVKLVGAKPVLADCNSFDDWNLSPLEMLNKITPKTRAVIVVHYAGVPCDMDEILSILKEENEKRDKQGLPTIYLIEDVAHAIGATYKGKFCGTFGDANAYSFFTNKNLSVGEGGMITTRDADLAAKIRLQRSHGMNAQTLDRHKGRVISYDVMMPGLNYRIDEMRSALGIVQLAKLKQSNAKRQRCVELYNKRLGGVKELTIPFRVLSDRTSSYHFYAILLPEHVDRNIFIQKMKDQRVQTSIHYPSFHDFTAFQDEGLSPTPLADAISAREVTLPLYPDMGLRRVNYVCDAVIKVLQAI